MKWSLNELRQAKEKPIQFEETLDLESALKQRRSDIISLTPVKVKGIFTLDSRGILGGFNVKTTITVPSTRTFEPVKIPLDFDFSEYYVSEHQDDLSQFDSLDVVIKLDNDILSLEKVIEDNILLQIPMQILSKKEQEATVDEMPQGENWDVLTEKQIEEDSRHNHEIDPRMVKLKNFFKENDDSNSNE
nr:YceD family protein [uncultured Ligilactobacillus sp.]